MSLAALEPKHYFKQIPINPSKKRAVRTSDLVRLTALYDKVLLFNNLTPNTQIETLKQHLIDIGSMRRHAYEKSKIWDSNFADSTFE